MERTLHLRVLMVEGNDLDASNMTYRCLTDNSNKKLRRPDKVDDDIHFINFQPYIKLAFLASCQKIKSVAGLKSFGWHYKWEALEVGELNLFRAC